MILPQSLHMCTETVQPPPVSICLRTQRSKSMGDHTRFLLVALSRVVVGSWQPYLHTASAGCPQISTLPRLAVAPYCKRKLQRQLQSWSLGRNVTFPRAAPWRLQRNRMSLDLKQCSFPSTSPDALPQRITKAVYLLKTDTKHCIYYSFTFHSWDIPVSWMHWKNTKLLHKHL